MTSPSINVRWAFAILIGIFVAAQLTKFYLFVPEPEFGGDAARKWFLAKDLADGSLEVFRAPEYVSHHYLRWGSWLFPTVLTWVFDDTVVVYYLSTFLPATLAAIIFLSLYYRHFGFLVAAFLALIWVFDPELQRALFQLLPTGAGLLPLALMILGFQCFVDGRLRERGLVLWLSVCLFWLYGAKETNIFFAPGVFAAVLLLAGRRPALRFATICLLLYGIEAMTLSIMQGQIMIGGRLLELLSSNGRHLEAMLMRPGLIEEQEALWDAGILSRWYSVNDVHVPIYLPSILAFIVVAVSGLIRPPVDITGRVALAVALSALSFAVLTSLFIVSLDPVRLGQPIRSRYLAILLPLSAFILIYAIRQLNVPHAFRRAGVYGLVAALILALSYFSYNREHRAAFLRKAYTALTFGYSPKNSLAGWVTHFENYGAELPQGYCGLDHLDFKRLYFGLMYVAEDSHGLEQLDIIGECSQATRLK